MSITQLTPSASKNRLTEIDIAKGIAIALVVWGHIVAKGKHPDHSEWYQYTKETVYLFHMPFFMFLSGLVAGIHYRIIHTFQEWCQFTLKKTMRLMPAYLLFGFIIISAKLALASYVHIDNLPPSFLKGIETMLFNPEQSSAGFLWFIYVLFLFYFTFYPLMMLVRHRPEWLALLGLVIYAIPAPELLMLYEYVKYFVFFFLGVWGGMHYSRLLPLLDRYGKIALGLFIILAIAAVPYEIPKLVLGISAIPAGLFLARALRSHFVGKWFHTLGLFSFPIYLLNTICIGLAKGIGLKLTSWDGNHFFFFAPLLFLSGIFIPIMVRKTFFCRVGWLEKITR